MGITGMARGADVAPGAADLSAFTSCQPLGSLEVGQSGSLDLECEAVPASRVCAHDGGAEVCWTPFATVVGMCSWVLIHPALPGMSCESTGNRAAAPSAPRLLARPAANTSSPAVWFFGPVGATFRCSLDGGPEQSCSSPHRISEVPDGPHVLRVNSVFAGGGDSASNPLSVYWNVDTILPTAPVITTKPALLTNSASSAIAFSGEPGASFSCSVDGGSYANGLCRSPIWLTSLSQGSHSISVRQTDEAGNTGPAAVYSWTIDLTPPSPPVLSGQPPAFTDTKTASISFTAATDKVFQCSVDGGPFASCTSPRRLTGLAEGPHSLVVRHSDQAGNVSSATASWSVDVTAPAITTSPLGSKKKTRTQTTYTLTTGTDPSGIVKAEYSTTSRPSPTAKPVTARSVKFANPLVFKTSSTIKWIRIQDGAGNWSRWYIA